ncbi:glyoxalase [Amycolatopsis deserti]|uniref:Glyoxalase n=1 Tax=Amycolatopsis deserti TaxID=185696 RepID=A0ABQ3J1I3_9PSEU|nr:VOC family protein [Amycolatopsis deserti]GHE98395.1 glyoxalase [Amycolatopsis deserti]
MSALTRLGAIVLDCPDPVALAGFYARLLDLPEPKADDDGSWVDLKDPSGVRISFQRVESYRAPEWPGQDVPQQLHLDLDVTDLEAAHEHAVSLGAELLDDAQRFRVYADPAGHPFCLCAC